MKRGKSYIESPEWLKNKRATINSKNDDDDDDENDDDDNYFQDALTIALNHQNIESLPERISNIRPFITRYNWNDKDFHRTKKTGKSLNKIIRQLLIVSYLYHTILKQ